MDFRILKRKLEIGKRIDDFLDNVSEAGLLFCVGVVCGVMGVAVSCG